jgi:hypothetical protein
MFFGLINRFRNISRILKGHYQACLAVIDGVKYGGVCVFGIKHGSTRIEQRPEVEGELQHEVSAQRACYKPPAPAAIAPRMAALRSPTAPCDPPFATPVRPEVVL